MTRLEEEKHQENLADSAGGSAKGPILVHESTSERTACLWRERRQEATFLLFYHRPSAGASTVPLLLPGCDIR
jgi:hypothetical protein